MMDNCQVSSGNLLFAFVYGEEPSLSPLFYYGLALTRDKDGVMPVD